jgi:hypothetical protein
MVIRNKKGVVKTLEAVIAVVALLAFILIILPEREIPTGEVPAEIETAQQAILDEISLNKNYRDCITIGSAAYQGKCQGGCLSSVESFVAAKTPAGYQAACEVCNSAISCVDFGFPVDKSVYTDSVFIANKPVTKVLRVYFYEK